MSDRSGTIDYIIDVPQTARIAAVDLASGELVIDGMRGAGVSASLGNGRLTTHNCFCDQKVRVENGAADIVFDWLEEKPLTIDAAISDDFLYRICKCGCDLHANQVIRLHASDAPVSEFHFKDDSAFAPVVVEQPVQPFQLLFIN